MEIWDIYKHFYCQQTFCYPEYPYLCISSLHYAWIVVRHIPYKCWIVFDSKP